MLTQTRELAEYFEATATAAGNPKAASNWVMGEVLRTHEGAGGSHRTTCRCRPAALAGLIRIVEQGTISSTVAKDVFAKMYESGRSADDIVAADGLAQVSRHVSHRAPRAEASWAGIPMSSPRSVPARIASSSSWSAR